MIREELGGFASFREFSNDADAWMRPAPLRLQRRNLTNPGRPVLGAEKHSPGTNAVLHDESVHMIAANATATMELHGAEQKRRIPHARTPSTPPHADILGIAQRSPASGRGNLRVFFLAKKGQKVERGRRSDAAPGRCSALVLTFNDMVDEGK
jgi:hypothetical protein